MAMLRGAVVHDPARDQLREFLEARLTEGLTPRAADPGDAALRAGIVSAMLVGLVLGRRLVGVHTLARAGRDELVRLVAPAVQAVLAPPPDAAAGPSGSAAPSRRRWPR